MRTGRTKARHPTRALCTATAREGTDMARLSAMSYGPPHASEPRAQARGRWLDRSKRCSAGSARRCRDSAWVAIAHRSRVLAHAARMLGATALATTAMLAG